MRNSGRLLLLPAQLLKNTEQIAYKMFVQNLKCTNSCIVPPPPTVVRNTEMDNRQQVEHKNPNREACRPKHRSPGQTSWGQLSRDSSCLLSLPLQSGWVWMESQARGMRACLGPGGTWALNRVTLSQELRPCLLFLLPPDPRLSLQDPHVWSSELPEIHRLLFKRVPSCTCPPAPHTQTRTHTTPRWLSVTGR